MSEEKKEALLAGLEEERFSLSMKVTQLEKYDFLENKFKISEEGLFFLKKQKEYMIGYLWALNERILLIKES